MSDIFSLTEIGILKLSYLVAALCGTIIIIGSLIFRGYFDKIDKEHGDSKERSGILGELWTTYGQILVSLFIVTVLTILLLTKTISSEAGLPILSAISGFAIAKGVPPFRTPPEPKNHDRSKKDGEGGGDDFPQETKKTVRNLKTTDNDDTRPQIIKHEDKVNIAGVTVPIKK